MSKKSNTTNSNSEHKPNIGDLTNLSLPDFEYTPSPPKEDNTDKK